MIVKGIAVRGLSFRVPRILIWLRRIERPHGSVWLVGALSWLDRLTLCTLMSSMTLGLAPPGAHGARMETGPKAGEVPSDKLR